MPRKRNPQKIPLPYVIRIFNDGSVRRGYSAKVEYEMLEHLSTHGSALINVNALRTLFSTTALFKAFKSTLKVPEAAWHEVFSNFPECRSYVRRWFKRSGPTSRRRSKFAIRSKLGDRWSDEEVSSADDDDASYLSIEPSGDECDETDVNLPVPVCQGIRRVCRNYDPVTRRYARFAPDKSENKKYKFHVRYAKSE